MTKKTLELHERLRNLADGTKTLEELALAVGRSNTTVSSALRSLGLEYKRSPKGAASPKYAKRQRTPENEHKVDQIKYLADGLKTSKEIAEIVGASDKYVQHILLQYNLPRCKRGGPCGELNGQYLHGRRIDLDGYVLVSAPENHPLARKTNGKNIGVIYEHRLVMERTIGRHLQPEEVVDHIDGLHLHNSPENLILFPNNKSHLQETIRGKIPRWSDEGYRKMKIPSDQRSNFQRIDTYSIQRKCGDVRLQQILRAWLSLGKDSPYLLGSLRWLERAGIVDFSHSNLQHHLQILLQKWGQTL